MEGMNAMATSVEATEGQMQELNGCQQQQLC